jgi:hypothetical protein
MTDETSANTETPPAQAPLRRIVVTDAPLEPEHRGPVVLSQKTQAEQRAGRKTLEQYRTGQ